VKPRASDFSFNQTRRRFRARYIGARIVATANPIGTTMKNIENHSGRSGEA
jgi:hypothetical protein